ncbi:MAG: NADH-ubiquinone oxidoreductase subunit 6 [Sulfobacillus thermosulfidooxidans]|uniref:NADH-quinone oxidoreductase subunit J n=1 Tax=Sulfobacillus thermotolerans TaxID=338644 RepID=A0ABM6RP41_9FIRM|nr:NADH-quinone oxidoreductase subunit J [Sulfobacillus sp. hq2]AUW93134.1 NADH-ubiquinone oxidoreductase subunit 6 [Sulfobacillus thermotolerans]POB10065.1 NADH-ubiquinone oxidoreductase subunit 6 [Sulfobacillus sp. hq2]PSR36742.1 MAG: NADH-ubiquinone oxidoreductase subunit 6 [Sulfobacillus thermosulfidooxidans]
MNWLAIFYGATSALTIACGLGVLLSDRPLLSGYFLTGAMVGSGAIFGELHSPMLAGIQILVYGGGVLIMMMFVIMVTPYGNRAQPKSRLWAVTWLLSPVSGILAAISYPSTSRAILGRQLGRQLLLHQGLSLELLAILLLAALAGSLTIAMRRQEDNLP